MSSEREESCPHPPDYHCPRCGECFPCNHRADSPGWICRDRNYVQTDSTGQIISYERPQEGNNRPQRGNSASGRNISRPESKYSHVAPEPASAGAGQRHT